jgi:hypothetical protein
MAMKKIFISQTVLDTLFSEGKATLTGDRLTIRSRGEQVFQLTPAYKFLYVAEGARDPSGLVGKIFTAAELEKIKADIYMDSVLVKEIAYQVETGYVGAPLQASTEPAAEAVSDQEMLQDYLLKIL